MGKFIRVIKFLFTRYYILFLLLVVLVSYGQMLGMYVWQDDNALFFKLAHIEERAGYLSAGPFGIGPYKYIATPYIPIYQIFGFNTIPYFVFTLALYFLTTICVYKVFSKILGESGGKVAGFLYASGYIASDGFIRLFNSVITSVSVILISLLILVYWQFYKEKKLWWYFLAIAIFFLATEFARGRTHYLISVILLFELLFLSFEKPLKSLFYSIIRLAPFIYIFYQYFVVSADHRSGQVKNLLLALSHGEFYQLYSFITSFLNVVIPDWVTKLVFNFQIGLSIVSWAGLILVMIFVFILLRNHTQRKILIPTFYFILLLWKFLANDLFSTKILNLSEQQIIAVFWGGLLLILVPVIFIAIGKYKKIYLFLILWVMLNIAAYSAYNPTVSYESVNRYLAHSFFAWMGIFGVFYLSVQKNIFWKRVILILILGWGVGNLLNSVHYQKTIVKERSNPPRNFYNQLKVYVPKIDKGDLFYFDVAENSQKYFADAFSVASMPETTAIAWRYGVDRYDINRFTEFNELAQFIKSKNVPPEKTHTFWYSESGLLDKSDSNRKFLFKGGKAEGVGFMQEENVLSLTEPLNSMVPVALTIRLQASTLDSSVITFPYKGQATTITPIHTDRVLQQRAFAYAKAKDEVIKTADYRVSSEWRERKLANLNDGDLESVWQADRVLWQKHNEYITVDLGQPQMIDRFVWVNGFANNTPTKYRVEVSLDSSNWSLVASENRTQRVDDKNPQVITFQPRTARYYKLIFTQTLGGDSPAIAEAWVVPARVGEMNITDAEVFLQHPFSFVATKNDFENLLVQLGKTGGIQLRWQSDKHADWQTSLAAQMSVRFGGRQQEVTVVLPAGGTQITKLKLSDLTIPGTVVVNKITARSLPLDELPF